MTTSYLWSHTVLLCRLENAWIKGFHGRAHRYRFTKVLPVFQIWAQPSKDPFWDVLIVTWSLHQQDQSTAVSSSNLQLNVLKSNLWPLKQTFCRAPPIWSVFTSGGGHLFAGSWCLVLNLLLLFHTKDGFSLGVGGVWGGGAPCQLFGRGLIVTVGPQHVVTDVFAKQ